MKKILETLKRKWSEYLLEILVIVIGILGAFTLNNWNQNRIQRLTEITLLTELRSNLIINENRLKQHIEKESNDTRMISNLINHLDQKLPYNDSLNTYFGIALLGPDIALSASAYETIKSQGFHIISSDKLRTSITDLFDSNYPLMLQGTIGLENQYWSNIVLPVRTKKFRLDQMLSDFSLRPIDYHALVSDQEYLSIIEFRWYLRIIAIELKSESLVKTQLLKEMIERELQEQ